MNTGFQITKEGIVFIRNGGDIYADTLANFATDNGEAAPALAEGVVEMLYEPGRRHFHADNDGVVGGGDMPWAWGDDVIARCDVLLAAKAEREYVSPPEPTEPEFGSVQPQLAAQILSISVSNGDVQEVKGAFNSIGMFYEDTGLFTMYFINEQPDVNYFVQGSGVVLRETDKQVDYVTVEALDATGSRFDPLRFGIDVYRM